MLRFRNTTFFDTLEIQNDVLQVSIKPAWNKGKSVLQNPFVTKEGRGVKYTTITVRIPEEYDAILKRQHENRSVAIRAALDFYININNRIEHIESSIKNIESMLAHIIKHLESGGTIQKEDDKTNDETINFLASGLNDFF